MRSLAVRVAMALVYVLASVSLASTVLAASVPSGFIDGVVASGLNAPTAMALAPDGRIFVTEQGGAVRVIKAGVLLPTPFVSLSVDSAGERGAIGIAFDPQFETNGFVYIHYTVPGATSHNRVSRFTASGDVAVPGSEFFVVDLDPLSSATNHNGGAIHFGPDGKLYIGVGENANGANAQTLTNRKGKLLRLNKDGSIPADNPFFGTATGANRAIWAWGLRNPFTFAFEVGTTRMFINDVGQSTWEEINLGVAGSNYGWPTTEGVTSNPSFRSPLYAYGHGTGATLGCAIAGGAFGHAGASFPASFAGDYFFADLCGGWINRRTTAGAVSTFASDIPQPVDLFTAPDGALFYLARGSGGATGFVGRIVGPQSGAIGFDTIASSPTEPFAITGWALDPRAPSGTGVSFVDVWAYPASGGSPTLVGHAEYGVTRSDMSARFGARFAPSGFRVTVRGIPAGPYTLAAFAADTVTSAFLSVGKGVQLKTAPRMSIDQPVNNSTQQEPFLMRGWALDRAAVDTGVSAVHVWAYPLTGGPPSFVGVATYGVTRSDVGATFGAQFANAGYELTVRGLAPGGWRLAAYALNTLAGSFNMALATTVQIRTGERMSVETPARNGNVSGAFTVSGWAIDTAAAAGTGVDAVHVWAFPSSGAPVFLGANPTWLARSDVAAAFGAQFNMSGFQVVSPVLPPGVWTVVVFARSTVTGAFSQSVGLMVTVH